ncbi:MAG: hypothetical protein ACI8W7_003444 [Gammaproteobacteria bacterium]|jgi:hypothetical protein
MSEVEGATNVLAQARAVPAVPSPLPGLSRHGWPWSHVCAGAASSVEQWPRISVVTPSLNQGAYLEAAMRSVLLQAYPHLEYIVLDGGSQDQSKQVIEHYASNLHYWRSEKDEGQSDAIARGLERASGDVLCWLNSDDLLLPGALSHVARLFTQYQGTRFVYGNRLVINAADEIISRHTWPRILTRYHWAMGQPMAQECCFWTRELYEQVGGLDRSRLFTMDHDLFYRMWRVAKFRKTPAVLGCWRTHDQTKNTRHQDVRQRELAATRSEFGLRKPGPLMARVINHLDRWQSARESRALPPLQLGVRVNELPEVQLRVSSDPRVI